MTGGETAIGTLQNFRLPMRTSIPVCSNGSSFHLPIFARLLPIWRENFVTFLAILTPQSQLH
jgi:hypothetical protein